MSAEDPLNTTLTENSLYDKYETMTQGLFAEVEVYLVELPENALGRIVDFFYEMAAYKCTDDPSARENILKNADLALDQANCHCHKVLTEEYQRLAQSVLAQYGDRVLRIIDNGKFFARVQRKQNGLEKLIEASNDAYQKAFEEIFREDPRCAEGKLGSAQEDELSARIAKSPEVREAYSRAYEAARDYYKTLIDDEERKNHLDKFKDHEERLQGPKQAAEIVGDVGLGLGAVGVLIFVFRKLLGI